MLQPIAGDDLRPATANAVVVRFKELAYFELLQAFIKWQNGLLVGRPHVGPDQAVMLLSRVPGLGAPCCSFWHRPRARRAAPHSGPARQTASRGSSSECRVLRPCRSKATSPGVRNADTPGRVCPFCRGTRSGLRPAPALCAACRWRLIPICIRKENKARSRRQCCSTARRSNAVIVFNANWNYTRPMGCQ